MAAAPEYLAEKAVQALLEEVRLTPKPGLVDRANNGAHRDMDLALFERSAHALHDSFLQCAEAGAVSPQNIPALASKLRSAGLEAERRMYEATEGINTHKGAIFTLGLLCCAAAAKGPGTDAILNRCADMTKGIVARDFAGITAETAQTNGEKLYAKYGITGIRGEAEAGFPTVANAGLPALEKALADGCSEDETGCAALLAILAAADDTNLIARSSRETQLQVRQHVSRLIQEDSRPSETDLIDLDSQFIRDNLSPGGSADLLAATWFLHFLKEI
jgi:holo-ACP synthase/triphosphoribosyl-dephospho-CoA synthase